MENKKIPLTVIVGPTASGKTALSIEIAKRFNAEIVSADSMQIYKEMDIATAKPTKQEMQGIVHHLVDCVDIKNKFSVAQYLEMARAAINDITLRGKKAVIVGGTGLYINSLVDNIQFEAEEQNALREELSAELEKFGGEYMLEKLKALDPEYANKLHPNNKGRIIRGIEINLTFGHSMSEHMAVSRKAQSPYNPLMIGITFRDRQKLYDRIDRRVDKMLEMGLVKEAEGFFEKFDADKTAVQAIGYKELFPYIKGELSLEEATDNLKRATRNYAKRQLTWFRKDQRIHWLYADELSEMDVLNKAFSLCDDFYIS